MEKLINGYTKILGIIGDPIEHSLSPGIHNTLCKYLNLNYVYIPFKVSSEQLENAVKGLKALGVMGFNVTIPHKKNIIQYLDEVSKEALLMGAVNTVKNVDGKLYGYNTDGQGFVKSLKNEGVAIEGKNILVIGAGGAARGITVSLALEGVQSITILNRTAQKAKAICTMINENVKNISRSDSLNYENFNRYIEDCDILINTTSIGMHPDIHACPIENLTSLKSSTVVCDLIYNPSKTAFLANAEKKGCKIINGWGMLVFQAINAFEIWMDIKINDNLTNILLQKTNS
ncbi:MAG: shikimate dehydrogenase [Clostridiales bacterium]|nr:shikimate dehydrogenase [Clostridiales bacterium]